MEISNRFAPEHLSIPDASLLGGVRHAGSVFVGPYSPEAAGDYASGPNHVLPTSGAARQRGGLSVTDYLKVISVQELSEPRRWRKSGPGDHHAGAGRRPGSARAQRGGGAAMPLQPMPKTARKARSGRAPAVVAMAPYSPPTGGRAGKLRLDFNENTVGCSPQVIEALKDSLSRRGPRGLSRIRRGQGSRSRATSA